MKWLKRLFNICEHRTNEGGPEKMQNFPEKNFFGK